MAIRIHPATKTSQKFTRRYGVRLRLGRGVHPVGQGSRSARVGPGTDKLVGIMGQNTPAMLRNLWSLA